MEFATKFARQWACSQLFPIPTSANKGTRRFATSAINAGTCTRNQSAYSAGSSKTNSSCTCMIINTPLLAASKAA